MSEQHGPIWEACSRLWCPRERRDGVWQRCQLLTCPLYAGDAAGVCLVSPVPPAQAKAPGVKMKWNVHDVRLRRTFELNLDLKSV